MCVRGRAFGRGVFVIGRVHLSADIHENEWYGLCVPVGVGARGMHAWV